MTSKMTGLVWERSKASGENLVALLAMADAADGNGVLVDDNFALLARMCRIAPGETSVEQQMQNILFQLKHAGEVSLNEIGEGVWEITLTPGGKP